MKGIGFKIVGILACVVTIFFFFVFATAQHRAAQEAAQAGTVLETEMNAQ